MKISELEDKLLKDGWFLGRKSGHKIYKHPTRKGVIVVPNHPSHEIARGTLESIKKKAGWK